MSSLNTTESSEGSGIELKFNIEKLEDTKEELRSFDHYLEEIGFGIYQIRIYAIMSLLALSEGSQVMIFTLMIPILEHEWKVEGYLNTLQSSSIFISFLLGSILSGQLADRFGRRKPLFLASFSLTVLAFLQALSPNIYILMSIRTLLGLLVGFIAPLAATIITEITPAHLRGRNMAILNLSLALGQIFGLVTAYFVLNSVNSGNWRLLNIISCVPLSLAAVMTYFYLDESARYELLNGNYYSGIAILEKMLDINSSGRKNGFSNEKKYDVINWAEGVIASQDLHDNASLKALFKGNLKGLTLLVWFNWFTASFVYYGIIIFMPEILDKLAVHHDKNDIALILISTVSEIIAVSIAAIVIDKKGFGRKNSMIMTFFGGSIISLIVFLDVNDRFVIWATATKLFMAMSLIFCFQFTSEIYPTRIRTTGIGVASGLGRVGSVFMPWICYYMMNWNTLSPFVVFSLFAFCSCVVSLKLPFDTMGRALDKIN